MIENITITRKRFEAREYKKHPEFKGIRLIDFWIYRMFGHHVINGFRKLFGLKIKRLYWKYTEGEAVIMVHDGLEKDIKEMLIKELERKTNDTFSNFFI